MLFKSNQTTIFHKLVRLIHLKNAKPYTFIVLKPYKTQHLDR